MSGCTKSEILQTLEKYSIDDYACVVEVNNGSHYVAYEGMDKDNGNPRMIDPASDSVTLFKYRVTGLHVYAYCVNNEETSTSKSNQNK